MHNEDANARRFIWSNGLQNIGDQIVAPKTTLPWLFSAAGVPAVLTSFLVPIRESGSMLPQAFLSPWVTSQRSRKRVWLIGSWGQFLAATLIAVSALLLDGAALGAAVLALLAVHAVFRSICSLAGKDVQGRTISKGRRGEITGRATELAGAFTLAVGLILSFVPNDLPRWALAALLFGGALTWALAAVVFRRIDEPEAEPAAKDGQSLAEMWALVKGDTDLQRFLLVRSLMPSPRCPRRLSSCSPGTRARTSPASAPSSSPRAARRSSAGGFRGCGPIGRRNARWRGRRASPPPLSSRSCSARGRSVPGSTRG